VKLENIIIYYLYNFDMSNDATVVTEYMKSQ